MLYPIIPIMLQIDRIRIGVDIVRCLDDSFGP